MSVRNRASTTALTVILCFLLVVIPFALVQAETAYVCVSDGSYLNARASPRKSSEVTMHLYQGDEVEVLGFHGEWAEIVGGETGTSFCKAKYLSSQRGTASYRNTSGGRVRIRTVPIDGSTLGWVSSGETIKISKVVSGWGSARGGWVDLRYFEPEQ